VSGSPRRSPVDELRSGVSRVKPRERQAPQPTLRERSPAELEVRFLSEMVAAHADALSIIDAAFSGMSPRGPDLVTLRSELWRRLDRFLEALLVISEERDAMDALVPFVFFVDEQVERALAASTEPGGDSWSQLQRDLFPERRAEGGDVFYELASEHLSEPTPRIIVIAAYLFCLKANFRGRLADEPEEAVHRWLQLLAERLPSGARRDDVRLSTWRSTRRTNTHLVFAAAAIVVGHFLVSLWAYLQ
jgi:type VI protein secretion system component VasF